MYARTHKGFGILCTGSRQSRVYDFIGCMTLSTSSRIGVQKDYMQVMDMSGCMSFPGYSPGQESKDSTDKTLILLDFSDFKLHVLPVRLLKLV